MKKIILLAVFILSGWNFVAVAETNYPADDKKIDYIKTTTRKDPRAPGTNNPVLTSELVSNEYINFAVTNFTGEVTVEITGDADGYTTSFYSDGSANEIIPIGFLPAGAYKITITLEAKGIYIGYFDL